MDEESTRELKIFGRDVSQIPCFRSSFLYGIGGGVTVGLGSFMATSRTRLSSHIGFATFCCTTLTYWFVCRYQWSKKHFEYHQLQEAMRRAALLEGTDVEAKLKDA